MRHNTYLFRCLMKLFLYGLLVGISASTIAQERSLGTVNFPVSCTPSAQEDFNQGLALLHHMMYQQAEHVFATITESEPDCAMAYWGIAMTQFHPLWAPPSTAELEKGKAAIDQAYQLQPPTERELAYIAATQAFYDDWQTHDHALRVKMWAEVQSDVFEAYPNDIDAGAFYALSLLATAPKQDITFKHQEIAGELLEQLLEQAPQHPALFHYTIHAYDNPMWAQRGIVVARGYDKLAPDVPHALHMPSHIFVRLGLWPEVIDWNIRSAAAAEAQSTDALSLHYIHAIDYLIYAYLQQGEYDKTLSLINTVNQNEFYQDSFVSAYGIAAAQARYPLERADWEQASHLPVRTHSAFSWDKYPQYEAITYYARGLGAARSGDVDAARQAKLTLDALYDSTLASGDPYWPIIVDAQRKTVEAWWVYASGDTEAGLQLMHEAADIEDSVDKHPVTPGAVMPARDMLGDMFMRSGQPDQALLAYEQSLDISPNRAYSLAGKDRAVQAIND